MDEPRPKTEDVLQDDAKTTIRIVSFDYLRSFVILLVLVHHAVLAYSTLATLNPENPPDTFSPIVDSQRWSGFDLIALFNDVFFMSLLFFISGFFVWRSLTRKGARMFLRDRFIRLGIPFVIGIPLLIPLAYFPAQLEVELIFGGSTNYIDFWLGLARAGFWQTGPLWFLWLLLAFNILIAGLYWIAPRLGDIIRLRTFSIVNHPVAFYGGLFGLSTIVYLPLVLVYGPFHWTQIIGPFLFQTSRILHYLVYFLAGTAVGVYGLNRTIFTSKSKLTRRWWVWMGAGLVLYVVYLILLVNPRTSYGLGLAFTATCATIVLGVIAIFLRFTKQMGLLDNLSNNAYGIYLIHYVVVIWLQYWLLAPQLPAILKALIVFTGTLILSWGASAAIRRIPAVARVI